MKPRAVCILRQTKETRIQLSLDLFGSGQFSGSAQQGLMDHLLSAFCLYSGCDINLSLEGDYHIDQHHSLEDLGIVLGKALHEALSEIQPISRFGHCHRVMDEALVSCTLDFSGRPFLYWGLPNLGEQIGTLESEVLPEFFKALTQHSCLCLHLELLRGSNRHHIVECSFKAFASALFQAKQPLTSAGGERVLSTKGLIEGYGEVNP